MPAKSAIELALAPTSRKHFYRGACLIHATIGLVPFQFKVAAEQVDCDAAFGAAAEDAGDADGTRAGFDCELTAEVSDAVEIPVIASGGAGTVVRAMGASARTDQTSFSARRPSAPGRRAASADG